MTTTKLPIGAAVALTALLTAACGTPGGPSQTGGTVRGDGSSTVFPVSQAVAEEFLAEAPEIRVTVGQSGTGGGFSKFCAGETDFNDASRPISESEIEECERADIDYGVLTVARDGLAIVANLDNDWVDCLTTDELATIWGPDSEGKVTNWKDVRDGFPDQALKLFGPGTDSGTFDYFTEEILGDTGASRADYTPSEDDNVIVNGVSGSAGGLGYFGFAYFAENADKLKLIAVDSGAGCVAPSDDTVRDGSYTPLSRPLFVYIRVDAAQRPEVQRFFDFYLDIVGLIAGDVGYTPLNDDELGQQVQAWNALKA